MKFESFKTGPTEEAENSSAPKNEKDISHNEKFEELFGNAEAVFAEYQKALEKERTELQEAAMRDPLTKLYNRRGFEGRMAEIIPKERSAPDQRKNTLDHDPLTLMTIDIDHFKKVNDTYGHENGDLALKALSDILRNELRNYDIISRFGGEEFVIAFPKTTKEEVLKKFGADPEKGEGARLNFSITVDGKEIPIAVSGGITEYGFNDEAESLEAALKRTDELLYAAKKNGRNQIIDTAPENQEEKLAA